MQLVVKVLEIKDGVSTVKDEWYEGGKKDNGKGNKKSAKTGKKKKESATNAPRGESEGEKDKGRKFVHTTMAGEVINEPRTAEDIFAAAYAPIFKQKMSSIPGYEAGDEVVKAREVYREGFEGDEEKSGPWRRKAKDEKLEWEQVMKVRPGRLN